MTNGEKIRAMTDDELADWINTLKYNCCDGKCGDCPISGYEDTEGVCDVHEWLKQEVSEDERN